MFLLASPYLTPPMVIANLSPPPPRPGAPASSGSRPPTGFSEEPVSVCCGAPLHALADIVCMVTAALMSHKVRPAMKTGGYLSETSKIRNRESLLFFFLIDVILALSISKERVLNVCEASFGKRIVLQLVGKRFLFLSSHVYFFFFSIF